VIVQLETPCPSLFCLMFTLCFHCAGSMYWQNLMRASAAVEGVLLVTTDGAAKHVLRLTQHSVSRACLLCLVMTIPWPWRASCCLLPCLVQSSWCVDYCCLIYYCCLLLDLLWCARRFGYLWDDHWGLSSCPTVVIALSILNW
jgi:hypothetical protein